MVNRSNFNVVLTNSSDAHAYEHSCSPNDGSKNQLKKCEIVCEGPSYPSNRSHIGVTFPLVVHWMAKHVIKLVVNQ